jgi:hypothetical protein
MAECAFCKAETELYDGGSPICKNCADARETKRKPTTVVRYTDVLRAFCRVIDALKVPPEADQNLRVTLCPSATLRLSRTWA